MIRTFYRVTKKSIYQGKTIQDFNNLEEAKKAIYSDYDFSVNRRTHTFILEELHKGENLEECRQALQYDKSLSF